MLSSKEIENYPTLRKESGERWHGSKRPVCIFQSEGRAISHLTSQDVYKMISGTLFTMLNKYQWAPTTTLTEGWFSRSYLALLSFSLSQLVPHCVLILICFSFLLLQCLEWKQMRTVYYPKICTKLKPLLGRIEEGPRKILSCTKSTNKFWPVHSLKP